VVVHGGAGVVAAKTRWREREKEERELLVGRKQLGRQAIFLVNFAPNFLHSLVMESTSIYKGWKRDILYLMVSNLGS